MSTLLRAGEREYRERLRKKDLEIAEQLDKIEVRVHVHMGRWHDEHETIQSVEIVAH